MGSPSLRIIHLTDDSQSSPRDSSLRFDVSDDRRPELSRGRRAQQTSGYKSGKPIGLATRFEFAAPHDEAHSLNAVMIVPESKLVVASMKIINSMADTRETRYDSWEEYYLKKGNEETGLVGHLQRAKLSDFDNFPIEYANNLGAFKEKVALFPYGNFILIPAGTNQVRCLHS
jgi:hypothetical protein